MVHQDEPRIREQAVRILGRDCRENGHVEYLKPEAKKPPAALKHLEILLAMAGDPDPGVRRELILAFRKLPTDKVGDALRKLAASWDGQDRWYLEALGLALENRETRVPVEPLRRLALWRPGPGESGRNEQGRAAAVFPGRPQRGVHRRRHAGPAGHGAEQVSRAGLAAPSPRGAAADRTCRPPLAGPGAATGCRRHPRADEGARDRRAGGRPGDDDQGPGRSRQLVRDAGPTAGKAPGERPTIGPASSK